MILKIIIINFFIISSNITIIDIISIIIIIKIYY